MKFLLFISRVLAIVVSVASENVQYVMKKKKGRPLPFYIQ